MVSPTKVGERIFWIFKFKFLVTFSVASLIAGLIIDTPLLLIDEPFVGLDVYAQQELTNILKEKKQTGQAIILTTHQFDQLSGIMDRYIMLHQGKLIKKGDQQDLGELKRRFD